MDVIKPTYKTIQIQSSVEQFEGTVAGAIKAFPTWYLLPVTIH